MKKNKKGMTLIELLAVIAIIAILFILLIPQINSAIEKSRISGVQTDFHSYEVAARGYLMEVGDDEKTEEGLNKFLDKNLQSNGGEVKEKGPWGHPYKIKVDNEKKQFVFTTLDKNKEPRTHKMIVSWDDDEIKSKYTAGVSKVDQCGREDSDLIYTDEKYFTVADVDGGVTIKLYSASGPKDVVIPCKINSEDVIDISGSVGAAAFQNKGINSVILPETLKSISENSAFENNNLKEIKMPQKLMTIAYGAFQRNLLENVELNKNIQTIGEKAFASNNIESVVIPEFLKEIPDYLFYQNKIKNITISDGVETIGAYAFSENNIEKLVIPETVKTIKSQAFLKNNISDLTLNEGLVTIGTGSFYINDLKEVIIPDTVTTIESSAFRDNFNLEKFTIGRNVTSIGSLVDLGDTKLKTVISRSSIDFNYVFNYNDQYIIQ